MRLIFSGSGRPARNMALDEALCMSLACGAESEYIRFYSWAIPTLSFGYSQKIENILEFHSCSNGQVGLVRRMSGGKTVFHDHELTFSIGLPIKKITGQSAQIKTFLDYFKEILTPFQVYFKSVGLPVEFANHDEKKQPFHANSIYCYSSRIGFSLLLAGKKLIGAAGLVRNGVMAVHGSIPISVPGSFSNFFKPSVNEIKTDDIACLQDWLKQSEISEIPKAIACTFSRHFELQGVESGPSDSENEVAMILEREKFSDLFWNKRKSEIFGEVQAQEIFKKRNVSFK